jgi:hypothetical protein
VSEWNHPTLTREQFDARVAELYAEGGTDEAWYYISFADEKFLGAVYLRAWHALDAINRAAFLGLNPGGEALVTGPLSDESVDENVPETDRYRLLAREEI